MNLSPSFKPVETEKEVTVLGAEIRKVRPVAEITLEGLNDLAKGKITDWQPARKIFTVQWVKKSESFDKMTEDHPGLRAYFKLQLFTTQLVFKSSTVRRMTEDISHFRIPEQLFHQQMRGALRVPVTPGKASILTPRGEFPLIDLSVGGAKVRLPEGSRITAGIELQSCELKIGTLKINAPDFLVKVTRVNKVGSEGAETLIAGLRFSGLADRHKTAMKQFLIDALKSYYEELSK
ncbi:MAG: PilZ domain-containing protein [Bdellovibrionales bacterium]|nr:PilZ domain-containing protein [Bdellovibrionales bacterium]